MGQKTVPLNLEHLAFGVGELLELLADEQGLEASRPPAPPNGGVAISTVADRTFADDVRFELCLASPTRGKDDSGLTMTWYWAAGWPSVPPWRLDVDVEISYYPWPNAPDFPSFGEFRRFRSILDQYAQPRLIVPAANAGEFRDDYLALLALFAVKEKCLFTTEDLVRHFRAYCSGLFQDMFDKLFRHHRRGQHGLASEEWNGLVDKVCGRLYHGKAGQGFTMPARPESFRSYVQKALRGEFAELWGPRQAKKNRSRFPESVEDAAAVLGVTGMTVRRWMKRLGVRAWSPETWELVSGQLRPKKCWQEITKELESSGLKPDAARKRVQRWKQDGLTTTEARRRMETKHPRGMCSACREEGTIGEHYRGKFFVSVRRTPWRVGVLAGRARSAICRMRGKSKAKDSRSRCERCLPDRCPPIRQQFF
jgi:hypothetical protein